MLRKQSKELLVHKPLGRTLLAVIVSAQPPKMQSLHWYQTLGSMYMYAETPLHKSSQLHNTY